jgi:hypothetical protein
MIARSSSLMSWWNLGRGGINLHTDWLLSHLLILTGGPDSRLLALVSAIPYFA